MKKQQKFTAALTALLILFYRLPIFAAEAELPAKDVSMISADALPADGTAISENILPADETAVSGDALPDSETTVSGSTLPDSETTVSGSTLPDSENPVSGDALSPDEASISGCSLPDNERSKDMPESGSAVPEAPAFTARIQLLEGYAVKGTFTEFRDDISRIRTLYSLDGVNYQEGGIEWDLWFLGTKDPGELASLQTQVCLYDRFEPLKSYVAGTIDRFYLKLDITLRNGSTYESKAAMIDRGEPESVPEGISLTAEFPSSISVIERNPLYCYGRYQLTVSPAATQEDIAALLPDTLPVRVSLYQGRGKIADCSVDCPIQWKPLSLPRLTAGASVTLPDAADEIIIPQGTLLRTPIGSFLLEKPLALIQDIVTSDEVRLVLNVVPQDGNPTGVLSQETDGLEIAFDLKPTGAAAIHAYIFSEQHQKWTALPDLALSSAVNAYPSAANSGYAPVLRNDQEPYRSCLAAQAKGDTPDPFIVGLKIEGGIYHGRQLVLPWPATYALPPRLPEVGGAGGNEGNAGSDNKDDSTDEGQRPNLPQNPQEEPKTNAAQTPAEGQSTQTDLPQIQQEQQKLPPPGSSQPPTDRQKQSSDLSRTGRKQNGFPGRTTDSGGSSNGGNAADTDLYANSTQIPAATADGYEENYADTYSAGGTPAGIDTRTASLTMTPANSSPSAGQEESPVSFTKTDRHGHLLPVVAVSAAGLCIVLVSVRLSAKRRHVEKC